ncbi:hypothetical protein LSAT2_026283 [Lamellibrachia satsuma]|nr:hypothetical protein LSAT2_026283 [Lamellibrachia satsuma]
MGETSQSLTLDSQVANVRPTPPPSSKMAVCGVTGGTTVPVHSLRVIRRLPSAAICESVLYGMPLLVDATSCWKTDWDELETNRHDFQALVKLLRHKNEVLLACLETTPSETVPKSRFVYSFPTPKPCGHFLLLPSHQPCHLLLKAVAVNEIILPRHFSSADEPTEETISVMDACLSQVVVESSYNPLLFSSGLCESLVTQLSTKGRPLTIAGKRKPQTSGGGNASSVGRSATGGGLWWRCTTTPVAALRGVDRTTSEQPTEEA